MLWYGMAIILTYYWKVADDLLSTYMQAILKIMYNPKRLEAEFVNCPEKILSCTNDVLK